MLWFLLFIPAIVLQTLWHELSHALMARLHGVPVHTFRFWPCRIDGHWCAGYVHIGDAPAHVTAAIAIAPLITALIPFMFLMRVHSWLAWVFFTMCACDVVVFFSGRFWGDPTYDINKTTLSTATCVLGFCAVSLAWGASTALTVLQAPL